MSKKTNGERLERLETQVEYVVEEIHDIKNILVKHIAQEDERHERLKKEFAFKWVEKWAIGIMSVIGLAVLATVLAMVGLN